MLAPIKHHLPKKRQNCVNLASQFTELLAPYVQDSLKSPQEEVHENLPQEEVLKDLSSKLLVIYTCMCSRMLLGV